MKETTRVINVKISGSAKLGLEEMSTFEGSIWKTVKQWSSIQFPNTGIDLVKILKRKFGFI